MCDGNLIKVNFSPANAGISEDQMALNIEKAFCAFDTLAGKSGKGNEFTGWLDLPLRIDERTYSRIDEIVNRWRDKVDVVVVIGIGGSYMGGRAAIEALSHTFAQSLDHGNSPYIVYAGHNLSGEYLSDLMDLLNKKSSACVIISKSGTTTEPALAFRLIKHHLESKYGKEEAKRRIVAITDGQKGILKNMADREEYSTFSIPDDVGGRYSVLTPVGLLPVALAGLDYRKMVKGASACMDLCSEKNTENPAIVYAAVRNLLYEKGKKIEIMVNYNPKLCFFSEWWKQLFGESEGKEGKGIFPASANYTTDLHSFGQYIQEGEKILFETVLSVSKPCRSLKIVNDPGNVDSLNYLSGKSFDECNKMAELGSRIAHIDGGVPNIQIVIPYLDEFSLGAMYYFFECACAISSYMVGVNPFDQPGVEAYKNNMFALLGKPGYEDLYREIRDNF